MTTTIDYLIMTNIIDIINRDIAGLSKEDTTRLRLVELRPRSESFADVLLSCSVSTNDPDDPQGWVNEQIVTWPPQQGFSQPHMGKNFNEIGGGAAYFHRFVIDYQFFYNELGTTREKAVESSLVIMGRVNAAIIKDRRVFSRLRDSFGCTMVRWDKAVVRSELLPSGSSEETFLKGKQWFQFEVYHES